MGGINSLSGLNKVNVDFRPAIDQNVRMAVNADQQPLALDINLDDEVPPAKTDTRNIVRQLDVLLLNAAGKSVAADAAKQVKDVGQTLVQKGVIDAKDAAKLESLAKDATEKLKALDKFSGRELAKALMEDKSGDLVWSKGFFGMKAAAKAVKAAVEAQEALSEALAKFNDRLASASEEQVGAALQDAYTELQFQCDRRATEIYSVAVRMHDLVQQDVVNGIDADPKTTALLDATFNELMPREAILMHGTAEALEKMNDLMGPLVAKLADFAADGGKELTREELATLQRDMATMKNAIANVRKNGLEIKDGRATANGGPIEDKGGRTVVDSSLLDAMEKVLAGAANQIAHARKVCAIKAREALISEIRASLSPEDAPGGEKAMKGSASSNPVVQSFRSARSEFIKTLRAFAFGKLPMDRFDTEIDKVLAKFNKDGFDNLEMILKSVGFDATAAEHAAKTVDGLRIVKAQFKEMMEATGRLMTDDADMGIATGDVRRILLGENSLSSLVEAKARGFKPGDVNPAADDANIVDSKELGSGAAGTTYLLTTKTGGQFVFKPELDSRLGLGEITLGTGGAYLDSQKAANLNLATQDTAKAFGCEDLVVKYSVGSHNGQFGIFMEKAKGVGADDFAKKIDAGGDDGVSPADMHKVTDPAEQAKIKGELAQKLNKLMWLDLITGQGDRHWGNYFVHVDKNTHEVTVKGIDNDASFSEKRIGLQKFVLDKEKAAEYEADLKDVCKKIHGKGWKTEYDLRVKNDKAIVRDNADGTMTIDLTKATSPEVKMAIIHVMGLQSIALPEEIDKDFYDKLMEMDRDPAKKKAYLDSIAPRVSPDALKATEMRLDEAIAHARNLDKKGKVYGDAQWRNGESIKAMTGIKKHAKIKKADGTTVEAEKTVNYVKDYCERVCPSYFKREFFHMMFEPPK